MAALAGAVLGRALQEQETHQAFHQAKEVTEAQAGLGALHTIVVEEEAGLMPQDQMLPRRTAEMAVLARLHQLVAHL